MARQEANIPGKAIPSATVVEVVRLGLHASDEEWGATVERTTKEALRFVQQQTGSPWGKFNEFTTLSLNTMLLPPDPEANTPQHRMMVTVVVGMSMRDE